MTISSQHLYHLAHAVLEEARRKKLKIVTAESCTGGLIAGYLTEIPGSSDVFDRGFVTYSYESKTELLSVNRKTLETNGAVSEEVALEMAKGALKSSHADIAISATGIAGPGGSTDDKPVGLVYLGLANGKNGNSYSIKNMFGGDRAAVRLETVETALSILKKEIESI